MRQRFRVALVASAALASACSPGDNRGTGGDGGSGSGTTPVNPPTSSLPHEREIRGGRLHNVAVNGIPDAATADPIKLIAATQADLRGRLGAVQSSDFVELHRDRSPAKNGAQLMFMTMRQTTGGIPIDDTYLYMGVRYDAAGAAKLVSSSYRLFENVQIDPKPAIPRDRAIALAQQGLRFRSPVTPKTTDLVVHQLNGHLQLAWSLSFPGSYLRAFVVASGAEAGRVHTIDQRVYDTTGLVTGPVVHGGAPGGLGMVETQGLPGALVSGGPTTQTNADAMGVYSIKVPNGTPLTASLNGSASVVFDQAGTPLTATAPSVDGGVTNLPMTSSTEVGQSQATAYFFVNDVHNFLVANGMDPALFGAPLPTNTNLNDICNAFYDPGARNINFFHSGGGCNNSAIDTVIVHEYGHFVDDFNGGIQDGALSEGWGDLLACLWSKQSVVGFDLFPGQAIRNCQNDFVYPPGGIGEVHDVGQAWQGFGWDVRQNLIAALGPSGDDLARALILPSFQSNAPDIPAAVREVFLRDDDDGDLSNQTPHWDQLVAAANHHGVFFAVFPDDTAPAPVMDLKITNVDPTRLSLNWTASGDDGNMGTAASYQLRWSTSPIDVNNFPFANLVATGAPKPAGSLETANITVPPQTQVFVALIVIDEQFNQSTLSNVVSATTPAGTPVFSESAETGAPGWTMTGLWHITTKRASDGSHAFWYGQEATGNYDTPGMANKGDLTSPIIDLSNVSSPVLVIDQFVDTEPDPFDLTQVIITDANDPTHTTTVNKAVNNTGGAFLSRVIPMDGFDGKHVTLTFHFDTIDSILNTFEGWYVDHLQIIGSNTCAHDLCVTGGPLDPNCSTCVAEVCSFDSFCCNVAWDSICVNEAKNTCGLTCTTCGNGVCEPGETPASCPQDCKPACAHDVCDAGVPLDPACDTCASDICTTDPFCCTVFWDRTCVDEADTICGKSCAACLHDECNVGGALATDCDACAANTCAKDPFCCQTAWDSRCVQEAADGCGLTCNVCSHSLCSQGTPLETSCDPCVASVCAADPYCCNNTWDQRCIDESETTCGIACVNDRGAGGTAGTPPPPR